MSNNLNSHEWFANLKTSHVTKYSCQMSRNTGTLNIRYKTINTTKTTATRTTTILLLYNVSQKVPTFKLSVTLSNLNRFAEVLHC